MAMTFTGSISAASAAHEEIRTMLYGAIGCNLAWGIVDAVMYLISNLTERGRSLVILRRVRGASDAAAADRCIAEALPPVVAASMRPADFEHLRQELMRLKDIPLRPRLRADDLRGAGSVLLLVFASTFPLVIPFLVMSDPVRALRTSHAIAIVMLFIVGYSLARFSGQRAWLMGSAMVVLGLVLVALTIALGG